MDYTDSRRDDRSDEVLKFLAEAHADGFLSADLAVALCRHRLAQLPGGERPAPKPPAASRAPDVERPAPKPPVTPPAPDVERPAPKPPVTPPAPEPAVHVAFKPAAPVDDGFRDGPVAAPGRRAPETPASSPPPEPARVPVPRPRRSRAEVWARFTRMRSKKLWGTFTADFAANALTYIGVLLSVVVIYVFFAFGYFGETIDEQHKHFRPLVEIGVVAFFLGLAWVLRHRSGIPQTSTAVEMIGIVLVPVMLSASFRDGCTPSYRPWCLPPDVNGPGRWAAYAAAGLIATGIYYLYARRRAIYAYLVAPMLWTSLGAFALYLEDGIPLLRHGNTLRLEEFTRDGISAPQLITVLAAIGVTIAIASRLRNTRLGQLLAVPTVRAGVFFTPFVLVLSLAFSYNDAISRGVVAPNLTDLAWPNVIATAIAAAVFAIASNAAFAWENLGARVRRDTALVLQVAAYLSLAASWLLTAGFGVSPAWLGVGLIGYAVVVALFDRFLTGPRIAAIWIIRTALMVGAALSLLEPGATLAAWGTLGTLGVLRSAVPAAAQHLDRFVPQPEDPDVQQFALWAPLLVAVAAGAARLGWPEATPLVLLGAGGIFAAAKLLPSRFADLRSFAGLPAVAAGLGSLGVEVWRQTEGIGFEAYAFSTLLIGLAVLAALVEIPTPARVGAIVAFVGAAALVALREYIGNGAWDTAWIDTTVLSVAGLALVALALAGPKDAIFYGIFGHSLIVAATIRSLWFEETAILGLSVLAVAHIAEAVNVELDRDGFVSRLARYAGPGGEAVRSMPTLIAAITLVPLTVLIGRQVPLIADERARFGPVLAGLSWIYLAGAVQRMERARRIAVPFAYAAGLAAVAVSAPSIMALLLTTVSAASVTALLAIRSRQPYATLPSWMLAVAAVLLAAYRAGVAGADLYLVLHGAAALLVLIPAGIHARHRARRTQADAVLSPWLVPPVYLGILLLPAALAIAVATGGWVAWIAVVTALSYMALGVAIRAGGVSLPAAAALSIAYASILYDNEWAHPFDQPLVWLPLAAAFVAAAALLPGNRRWRLLLDPAPGLVVAGLGIAGLATAYSHSAGVLDTALVGCAALLAAVYLIRAEEPWLIASGVTLVTAGLVAGGYWAPATTLTASLVLGFFADRKRELPVAPSLRAAAAVGVAVTFGLVGVWIQWTAAELVAIAGIGAVIVMAGAVVLTVATSWPRRVLVWAIPVHVLGHGLTATSYLAAVDDLAGATPFGLATLLALLEAAALGLVGTMRRRQSAVSVSAGFIAGAYVLFAYWMQWGSGEAIAYTAIAGAILSLAAAAGFLGTRRNERLRIWLWPTFSLGQIAGAAVVAIAVIALDPSAAAGIAAGVLAFDAAIAGSVGTIRRSEPLIAGSAALAAVAYGLVAQWLAWTPLEFVGWTGAVAAVLAVTATIVTELRRGRWLLWMGPLHGLTALAVAAVGRKVLGTEPGAQELWTLAAVALGYAAYLSVNAAAAPKSWNIRTLAVAFFVSAAALAVGGEAAGDGAVFTIALLVAGLGLIAAIGAGLLADTANTWRAETGLLAAGLLAVAVGATVAVFDPLGLEMGTLLVIVGAALAGYGLLAHNLAVIEGAMVTWLGALMILVNERMELTLHAAVIIVSVTLLATIELERYRRRLADEPIPAGLHHLEWVLMLAPLTLAVADMFESLWFGLALFAEGLLLTGWGAMTEVRRRALLGVGAMIGAIVLSVIIPALHGISAGLTGGTWLAIGAIAATVFIIAGSTIERRRHAIGRRLAHLAEILEDWE